MLGKGSPLRVGANVGEIVSFDSIDGDNVVPLRVGEVEGAVVLKEVLDVGDSEGEREGDVVGEIEGTADGAVDGAVDGEIDGAVELKLGDEVGDVKFIDGETVGAVLFVS